MYSGISLTICSDSLFLSSYPPAWLAYFYMLSVPVTVISVFVISPMIAAASNYKNCGILLVSALILLWIFFISGLGLFWAPFILCLYIILVKMLTMVICYNTVASAFDIRSYKHFGSWFMLVGTVGAILAGYSLTLVTKIISIWVLIPYIVILIFIISCLLLFLKPQSIRADNNISLTIFPIRVPLIRHLMLMIILFYIIIYF